MNRFLTWFFEDFGVFFWGKNKNSWVFWQGGEAVPQGTGMVSFVVGSGMFRCCNGKLLHGMQCCFDDRRHKDSAGKKCCSTHTSKKFKCMKDLKDSVEV